MGQVSGDKTQEEFDTEDHVLYIIKFVNSKLAIIQDLKYLMIYSIFYKDTKWTNSLMKARIFRKV